MKIGFYLANIYFRHFAEDNIFQRDIAYFHYLVGLVLKWHGYVVRAVELLTDNTRAKSIAVKTYHQIKHGRTVVGLDTKLIDGCTEKLLCDIEGAVVALLE